MQSFYILFNIFFLNYLTPVNIIYNWSFGFLLRLLYLIFQIIVDILSIMFYFNIKFFIYTQQFNFKLQNEMVI